MSFCGGCVEPENSLESQIHAVFRHSCVCAPAVARWLEYSLCTHSPHMVGGMKLIDFVGYFIPATIKQIF